MTEPLSSSEPTFFSKIKAFFAGLHWTRVGVLTALAIVALYFVLSGVGQPRVSAFASVKLENPTHAATSDQGTVILDSERTRLIFVDPNNELRKIVQVNRGELPITEVSDIELTKDAVYVTGATRTDDGETIASESVLCFDYDGSYNFPAWDIQYVSDKDKEESSKKDKGKGESGKSSATESSSAAASSSEASSSAATSAQESSSSASSATAASDSASSSASSSASASASATATSAKSDSSEGSSNKAQANREAYFEPTILDVTPVPANSDEADSLFLTRSAGFATAGVGIDIHRLSIATDDKKDGDKGGKESGKGKKDEKVFSDELYSGFLGGLDEFVHSAVFLPDIQRSAILGDWGSIYVAETPAFGNASAEVPEAMGYVVSPASNEVRYDLLDASGDSLVAYDSTGSKLVLFDGLSSGKPKESVIDRNIDVESVSFDGASAVVVLKSNEIRRYDIASGTKAKLTEIYPQLPLRVHAFILDISWAYLIILGLALIISSVRKALKEGRQEEVRRGIISFMAALVFVGFLVNSFYTRFSDGIEKTTKQLSHAAAIVGFTSPKTIGDTVAREVSAIESGRQDSVIYEHAIIKAFIESFSASSYKNGVGMQSNLFGVSSDGSKAWNIGASQRSSVTGSEVTDEELRNSIFSAASDAAKFMAYKDIEEVSFAISAENPVHQSLLNSRDGYLFTCFVPIVSSNGSCHAVLEVSQRFGSFLTQQTGLLFETILSLVLLTIGIYYASNEVIQSGAVILRYRQLKREGAWNAGALLTRPLIFIVTMATSLDAALAVVLARDMLTAQGVDSNAFLWSVPALAITAGDLVGTLAHGHFGGRMNARPLTNMALRMGLIGQCACIVAISWNSFWLFVIGKFFAGMGYSVAYSMVFSFCFTANKEDRPTALAGLTAATPARILAGVLGGVLAAMGPTWVYMGGALCGVAIFVIVQLVMPADRVIVQMDSALGERKLINFVLSKKMIFMALFVMIPVTLAGGYQKFIFPLFLDTSGISKQQIANFFVIADVVMYAANSTLRSFRSSHDSWKTSWLSLLALAATFYLFSFNQSPLLAILAIVVINILSYFAKGFKRTAATWANEDYGYDRVRTYAALRVEDAAIKNVRAPMLGSLQIFGGTFTCVVLSIVFAVSGVLYALTTRKYWPVKTDKK